MTKRDLHTGHKPACHRPDPKLPRTQTPKRILIVDDDSSVREMLGRLLADEGYVVDEAVDGVQALTLATQGRLDLMLLDLNMPLQNGWETFERLTAEAPFLPVIIITARPNQLFRAAGAGVGALLEKPLDFPTLLRTISTLLAQDPEVHLARRAGKRAELYYQPAAQRGPSHDHANLPPSRAGEWL